MISSSKADRWIGLPTGWLGVPCSLMSKPNLCSEGEGPKIVHCRTLMCGEGRTPDREESNGNGTERTIDSHTMEDHAKYIQVKWWVWSKLRGVNDVGRPCEPHGPSDRVNAGSSRKLQWYARSIASLTYQPQTECVDQCLNLFQLSRDTNSVYHYWLLKNKNSICRNLPLQRTKDEWIYDWILRGCLWSCQLLLKGDQMPDSQSAFLTVHFCIFFTLLAILDLIFFINPTKALPLLSSYVNWHSMQNNRCPYLVVAVMPLFLGHCGGNRLEFSGHCQTGLVNALRRLEWITTSSTGTTTSLWGIISLSPERHGYADCFFVFANLVDCWQHHVIIGWSHGNKSPRAEGWE